MSETVVKIFDTTLRDGEQSPGCSMNTEEKLRMAQQLAKLNVDVIEAGFPVASDGDFEAVSLIAEKVRGVGVCGLSRANKKDIDRCWEAVRNAEKPRIHTFIATSDIHMKHKLRKTREEVLKDAVEAVAHAKHYTDDVEFSAEDSTRSEPEFLAKIFSAVIEAGATTINVPDTVGYTVPSEFGKLIGYLSANVKNVERAVISVHCHNDLGLAVANSVAAVENGARQVECTINGIGERAGNASLEEIVMTLNVRRDRFPVATRINTAQLYPSSKLLTLITGVAVQPNKAVVGANAFAHEAGIHQDGVLKHQQTYEIMTPESVGIPTNRLVMGKHSGRHAFAERLRELGTPLEGDSLNAAFKNFKDLSDRKKFVYDEDILSLVEGQMASVDEKFRLEKIHVVSGNVKTPSAKIIIRTDGKTKTATQTGDGPVDAAFRAIRKLTGFKGTLERYGVSAITGGTDAQGEVVVTVADGDRRVRGTGAHTDIVTASAMAFLSAINRLAFYQTKKAGKGI